MKTLLPLVLFALLFLSAAVPAVRGEEAQQRLSVTVQFTGAPGNVHSASVSKTVGEELHLPLAVSESALWTVTVCKMTDSKAFSVILKDPAAGARQGDKAAADVLLFSGDFAVESGKKITVLKTDQYQVDVTLTVE